MQNPQHGGPHNNYLPLHPAVVTTNRVVYKDKVINQYTFGTKIGKGKNGTVYAAYLLSDDETTVETVAIKAIRRETNEGRSKRKYRGLRRNIPRQTNHTSVGDAIHSEEHRIRKEIAIMKKLHHPHVVQLREVLDDRLIQTIYLVMEYCDGGEVEWTDGHDNPISSLEQTRRIMRDAIQGLDYLHSQGIIHRDIKPANLLWTKDRAHVKIADFGTAHFSYAQRLSSLGNNTPSAEDPDDPFFLDDSGLAIKAGTPIFMAPEVVYDSIIRDDEEDPPPPQPITKAIDVWALGITFYCLLFGCLPYKLDHNLPSLSQEFAVYRSINKEEWSIKDTMGTDQISTQSADEDSEAGIIIHLLYHFLTKNVTERITLAEVKSNPWFLNDLPNPVTWLQDLGVAQIIVSPQETSVAITSTEVKLGPWKRMARGISSVLGIGPILTRGRERQRDDQSSSSQGQQLGRHRTVTDMVRRPKEHLKGKGKEVERSLSRLRSSATLGRQLSVKSSRNDPTTRSSNNSSMTWRFSKRSSQSSTPKPASPQEPNMSTFIPTRATSNSRLVGPRASAEVLGYPQSSNHGGGLTSDRRVSSFGDHPAELRNTVFEDNDDVVGDGHLQFGAPSSDSDENDAEGDSEEGTSQPRMVAHHLRQRLYDIPPSRHKSVDVIPYERERELDDSSSDDDDDGEGILIDFPRRR